MSISNWFESEMSESLQITNIQNNLDYNYIILELLHEVAEHGMHRDI